MRAPLIALLALTVTGCTTSATESARATMGAPVGAQYLGVDTRLLDGDLVSFVVRMTGARGRTDAVIYARCAAAQYALIRGYSFARHVRTTTTQEGAVLAADGVYTISPDLPAGLRTIDAEVTVADCREQGIPTV